MRGLIPTGKRLQLVVAVAAFALSLVGATSAQGDGAATIAAGPTAVWGRQTFGTTSTVPPESHGNYHSWWNLSVTTGDHVMIDWGAPNYTSGAYPELQIFPPGTNDYNLSSLHFGEYHGNFEDSPSTEYWVQAPGSNGLNQLEFTAGSTGDIPFDFTTGPGNCCSSSANAPYYFTADVIHTVVLGLNVPSVFPRSGLAHVWADDPAGVGINDPGLTVVLQLQSHGGSWITIGSASPAGGTANIAYTVPASVPTGSVTIRASASGVSYAAAASRSVAVRLQRAIPVKHCAGSLWHRLACNARKLKTVAQCGLAIASFGVLKGIKGIKVIKGFYDTHKVSDALRPAYTVYNDLMRLRLKNGTTGSQLWARLQKARTIKELVSDVIDVGRLVTDTRDRHFEQFVKDFADLAGVGACVDLVTSAH